MNERIQILVDQAEDYADEHATQAGEFHSDEFYQAYTQKLAELIVRECADYVQFYYKDHACEVIAHDMKTHFGVK